MKLNHLRNSKAINPNYSDDKKGDDQKCTEGKKCPNIYLTDRGTFIVQGWVISDEQTLMDLDIPPGESAVEIPLDLLPELTKESAVYA